jgi:hypothetical protein
VNEFAPVKLFVSFTEPTAWAVTDIYYLLVDLSDGIRVLPNAINGALRHKVHVYSIQTDSPLGIVDTVGGSVSLNPTGEDQRKEAQYKNLFHWSPRN